MKSYILEFKKSNLDNNLRTGVIDLYVNNQYVNYSVRRSAYGSNLLDNGIYTGANSVSEIGYIEDNSATPGIADRFVDTSGRIDIVDWQIEVDSPGDVADAPVATLSVFHSANTDNVPAYGDFSDSDWAFITEVRQDDPLYLIAANRYAFFELDFDRPVGSADYTLRVLIEIDPPVVDAFFDSSKQLINKFPSWMDINEYGVQDIEYIDTATPTTLGGSFINAMAGEWISDIAGKMDYQQAQYYVDSVDLTQKAWVYRAVGLPFNLVSVRGDSVALSRTASLHEFYQAKPGDHAMFWSRSAGEIYTLLNYGSITVDGESFGLEPYHVWNSIDDIGATVDLFRMYLESNENFVKRIKDTFVNQPGTALGSFKAAVRRELDLWQLEGATPDSFFSGATPEVLEMADIESNEEFFDLRGLPTPRFRSLIDDLARKYPVTWGFFVYNKSFWDPDGLRREGFGFIPKKMDVDPLPVQYLDSGVGDVNDAYLLKPDINDGSVNFSAKLKLKGRQRVDREEYGPLSFDVAVYPRADLNVYNNAVFNGKFTIEITTSGATPTTYFANIDVEHQSNVDAGHATPTNASFVEWTTSSGTTSANYTFYHRVTGAIYDPPGVIYNRGMIESLTNISSITIRAGHWNPTSATYTGAPVTSQYRLWFAPTPEAWMGQGGSPTLTDGAFDISTKTGSFYLTSLLQSNSTVGGAYIGDKQVYTIRINDNNPAILPSSFILNLPDFSYPPTATNREIVLELLTSWDGINYGAQGDTDAATPIFLSRSYIVVNESSTWSSKFRTFSTATTQLDFSSTTGPNYPYTVPTWIPFEADQIMPYSGEVDANGPLRDGEPLPERNTDYMAKTFTGLERSDFGIPNTQNYIITWIGVGSVLPSEDVLSWLPTNTVKPAVTYSGEAEQAIYPANVIVETLVGPNYTFSPIVLNARLRPGFNKKWNPRIHSGWIFDSDQEYYIYSNPKEIETTTNSIVSPSPNRQGAPISVYGLNQATPAVRQYDLRQVVNFNLADSATPVKPEYTLGYRERVRGTGDSVLYAAYEDIYDIKVRDITSSDSAPVESLATVWDDFLSNTTVLANRIAPSGQVWGAASSMDINGSGSASRVSGSGLGYIMIPGVNATFEASFTQANWTNGSNGIYFRNDSGVNINEALGVVVSGTSLSIVKRLAGVPTVLATATIALGNNDRVFLSASISGNSINAVLLNISGAKTSTITHTLTGPDIAAYSTGTNVVISGSSISTAWRIHDFLVREITPVDVTSNVYLMVDSHTISGNEIQLLTTTDAKRIYELTYRVRKSFYADNNVIDNSGNRTSLITFDQAPIAVGYNKYVVTIEDKTYNPATPIDLPMNMMYTSVDEGFIYIDHEVHELERIEATFSPARIVANGYDYGQLTVRTYDRYGNPKPNIVVQMYTSFGSLSESSVTTDSDGFATLFLTSEVWDGSWNPAPATPAFVGPSQSNGWVGTILCQAGSRTSQTFFSVELPVPRGFKIFATTVSDAILSNAESVASIQGKVTDLDNRPVNSAKVYWRKGRTIYETLSEVGWTENIATPGLNGVSGYVLTDQNGRFIVEPFISAAQPGYWFVSVETQASQSATPVSFGLIGDIVSWCEFPNVNAAIEPITNQTIANYQDATPSSDLPYYPRGNIFPVTVDEQDPQDASASATPDWIPPVWYAIGRYRQYQMGLMGSGYYEPGATPSHPDHKEF